MEQARAGTPSQQCSVRTHRAQPPKSLASGATITSRGPEHLRGCLQPRVPRSATDPCGSGSSPSSPRQTERPVIELGRDFCFVGSEYPLQVGGRDFALDLLFFHRELNALVAIELKIGEFQPEYLGKLDFYLEALDRDVRKAHERPSI